MKLTVFQSDKGDCLLLTSGDDTTRLLVDGGMEVAYKEFVAPALGSLAAAGHQLDLVYVSHNDADHIAGVLQLLDDMVEWRVHEFQRTHGNPTHPAPASPRPPDVKAIWHNAFADLVNKNLGPVEDLLAASAAILSGAEDLDLLELATTHRELAASIPQAWKVSQRISAEQLGIPLNPQFGGRLAMVRAAEPPPPPIQLGSMSISVIGPFAEDVDRLRQEWNNWLDEQATTLKKLQKQAEREAKRLGINEAQTLLDVRMAQVSDLGNRKKVTPPNLASLMILVEENEKRLLLTGDGHWQDIVNGLAFHDKFNAAGLLHVDVLKVQHHGAEFNINEEFLSRITADHYIFCGNGEHANPDLQVLTALIESRVGQVGFRATNPAAQGPFKLWFNSSESATKNSKAKTHMEAVKKLVEERVAASNGRMSVEFLEGATPSFELAI